LSIYIIRVVDDKSKKVYAGVAMRNKVERKPPGEYQSMVFMVFMKKGEKR